MQSSRLIVSTTNFDINQISPGRKKSPVNPGSILKPDFFENQISEQPGEKTIFGRPRSNDVFTNFIPIQACTSCESEAQFPLSDNPTPESKMTKVDHVPTRRHSQSLLKVKKIKSAEFLMKDKSIEEKNKWYRTEIHDNITAINVSSNIKKLEIAGLKQHDLTQDPDGKSLLSLNIGEAILQPKNGVALREIAELVKKGKTDPRVCGEEWWRSMRCIKLYNSNIKHPILEGSTIDQQEDRLDESTSIHVGKLLNFLFQHFSKSSDELIPSKEFGSSQIDAGNLGLSFVNRLKKKRVDSTTLETMQLVLGLGKQEIYTRPADLATPKQFKVCDGNDNLMCSEYSSAFDKQMKYLQYDREISIILREDGGLQYIVAQPVTIKDRENNTPLGTCRIESSFIYDKFMNCVSQSQEIKAATVFK